MLLLHLNFRHNHIWCKYGFPKLNRQLVTSHCPLAFQIHTYRQKRSRNNGTADSFRGICRPLTGTRIPPHWSPFTTMSATEVNGTVPKKATVLADELERPDLD